RSCDRQRSRRALRWFCHVGDLAARRDARPAPASTALTNEMPPLVGYSRSGSFGEPMTSTTKPIAVYGATGHPRRFVVQAAQRRGLPVAAVGRDAARLDETFPSPVVRRVAVLDDPASLEQAFAGCAVVINCAGPYLDTAAPVAQAALRAGCHSIDVTA